MKQKAFLLLTICLFCFATLNAQSTDAREKLSFGIKAGVNVSNVWDTKGEEFVAKYKTGFAGGVFLGIPIGTFLGVQPEILISQKGFKGSGNLLGLPYTTTRTTTYLDIPLQLQVKPAEFLTILAGPQYSYLLNQKDKYSFDDSSTEQEQEFNNDNVRKNILGFVVGADVIYRHLVLSGRFGWDFQTNNGDGTSSTPSYKNKWWQFTLGFII